jgi:hypothetical protein
MRPSGVVVRGAAQKHSLQVAAADHQDPVQALRPDRANPPLGECVRSRCSDRGLDHPRALGAEHFVEGMGELGVTVADEEPEAVEPLPTTRLQERLRSDPLRNFLLRPDPLDPREAVS